MTDPPMYNVASAVLCRSLAIVRSLPLPGCNYESAVNSEIFAKVLLSQIALKDIFAMFKICD